MRFGCEKEKWTTALQHDLITSEAGPVRKSCQTIPRNSKNFQVFPGNSKKRIFRPRKAGPVRKSRQTIPRNSKFCQEILRNSKKRIFRPRKTTRLSLPCEQSLFFPWRNGRAGKGKRLCSQGRLLHKLSSQNELLWRVKRRWELLHGRLK